VARTVPTPPAGDDSTVGMRVRNRSPRGGEVAQKGQSRRRAVRRRAFRLRRPVRFCWRQNQGDELCRPKLPAANALGKFVSMTPRTPPARPRRRCPLDRPPGASNNVYSRQPGERLREFDVWQRRGPTRLTLPQARSDLLPLRMKTARPCNLPPFD
jgi:hypothetical protein